MKLNKKYIGNASSNRLIIFLHEGLGSIAQWKSYPDELCQRTDSYGLVYDRAGYGNSPGSLKNRSVNYLHEAAEELKAFISGETASNYEIYLYGHSDGGSIALIYAAKYGSTIAGIITEAAHVFVEEETLEGVLAARPLFNAGKFDGLQKYHGDRYAEVFYAWNDIWLAETFKKWEIISMLGAITNPQLVIQGKDDQYGTTRQVELIKQKTNGETTTYLIDNCGHAPFIEQKSRIISIVENWLNGN